MTDSNTALTDAQITALRTRAAADQTRYDMRTAEITRKREFATWSWKRELAQLTGRFARSTRSIFHLLKTPCAAKASVAPHTCGSATPRGVLGSERTTYSIAMSVLPDLSKR